METPELQPNIIFGWLGLLLNPQKGDFIMEETYSRIQKDMSGLMESQHELDKTVALVQQKQIDFETRIERNVYDINVKLERIANLPTEIKVWLDKMELQAESRMKDVIRLHIAECGNNKKDDKNKTDYIINGVFTIAGGLVTIILMMIKGYFEGKP